MSSHGGDQNTGLPLATWPDAWHHRVIFGNGWPGSPVTTRPDTWHYSIISGNGWPGVRTLTELDDTLNCNIYLSVAARTSRAVPEIQNMLLGRYISNRHQQQPPLSDMPDTVGEC